MSEPVEIPLREKYLNVPTPKFGGKKRNKSNEGKVGRKARAAKRCITAGSSASKRAK